MTGKPMPSEDELKKIVGHRFPGGRYTIAHWENFLLTECTGSEPLPDKLAHPVALFHVPFLGAQTTIGEMFALGQADSDSSIGIESYVWEFFAPMREDQEYQVDGEILSVERKVDPNRTYDRIAFRFDLTLPEGGAVAATTVTWHYNRQGGERERAKA